MCLFTKGSEKGNGKRENGMDKGRGKENGMEVKGKGRNRKGKGIHLSWCWVGE
jgi:hypothetical protein